MNHKFITSFYYVIVALICTQTAQAKNDDTQYIPLLQYDDVHLRTHNIQSSSIGLLTQNADIMFIGLYTKHDFNAPLAYNFPQQYHTIDTLLDAKNGRDQYLGIFKSQSDQPIGGGINTFHAGVVYGYEFIRRKDFSLVLGGGIAAGNFGLKTADGNNWPLIPVPLARLNYHTEWIDSKFEFLTSPDLSFTIAPKSHVRLTGDFRMNQFRDARDIIFELALAYRPYTDQDEFGDFAGISVGIKNDNFGAFKLGNKAETESIEVHYYALFAAVDISVVKVSAGHTFGGRTLYRETIKQDMGEGYFVTVQGMYPF